MYINTKLLLWPAVALLLKRHLAMPGGREKGLKAIKKKSAASIAGAGCEPSAPAIDAADF